MPATANVCVRLGFGLGFGLGLGLGLSCLVLSCEFTPHHHNHSDTYEDTSATYILTLQCPPQQTCVLGFGFRFRLGVIIQALGWGSGSALGFRLWVGVQALGLGSGLGLGFRLSVGD